ncbi:hypothetical protein SISSUDRAFT_1100916 [Sistotremastrum suecicum HHB10207 ss-3]|uniref:Uncharacterized protein n=1 Tax=Sistotremastrum suecicum HHB10207 ss-3 TaxID=1314776 RepID=A0A165WV49_9AGAM|nr:hypothetical protein SISSUDRAFT_1100916 [Sistotremastrum suecicum HHB10207 ss-3]
MAFYHTAPAGITSFPRAYTEHEIFNNGHLTEFTPPASIELRWQTISADGFYTNAFIYPFDRSITPHPPRMIPVNCGHHTVISPSGAPRGAHHSDAAMMAPASIGQRIPLQCDLERHELTYLGHVAYHTPSDWVLFVAIDESRTRLRRLVYVWWGTSWRQYIRLFYPAPCTTCDTDDFLAEVFSEWEIWMKLANRHWRKGEKILKRLPSFLIPLALHILYKKEPQRPPALIFPSLYKRWVRIEDVPYQDNDPFERPSLELFPSSPTPSFIAAIYGDDEAEQALNSSALSTSSSVTLASH